MSDTDMEKPGTITGSCGCSPGTCCQDSLATKEIPQTISIDDQHSCECGGSCNNQEKGGLNRVEKQGLQEGAATVITPVSGTLTSRDTRDHILARLGQNRSGHRVNPGLYSLGSPVPDSPVIVTANYTLSFDAVRSSLASWDAYILVLDTRGINVWCAAGKGTFGTEELVNRIRKTGLSSVVRHHRLILPQLGAPGIAAHEVYKATGFHIEYGPVRAADLPEFLRERVATPEMRVVDFNLMDRIVLIPVELRGVALYTAVTTIVLWFLGGWLPAAGFLTAVLAGTVIFPILLPYLPTTDFSSKGFVLGTVVAAPFAVTAFLILGPAVPLWVSLTAVIAILFTLPAITAFLALNFTGCTTFTSRTGVKKEIYRYIPIMAGFALIGAGSAIVFGSTKLLRMW